MQLYLADWIVHYFLGKNKYHSSNLDICDDQNRCSSRRHQSSARLNRLFQSKRNHKTQQSEQQLESEILSVSIKNGGVISEWKHNNLIKELIKIWSIFAFWANKI